MIDPSVFWITIGIIAYCVADLYWKWHRLNKELEQFKRKTINEITGLYDRFDNNVRDDK